ncbi:hypothetical protein HYN56_11300 [Flavobacterium crocinum]|uniref:Uncharacterized protein n=1 Tax=Flavobacterium crocinum TaxID=2183896 RepID=A0A2S1YLM1_9FLAO|nr:hypothetical protein [Flavobacterium crocinum]AWK04778.1 hypothetical protein HYN56_11300 [Flavobacterium crocinum]
MESITIILDKSINAQAYGISGTAVSQNTTTTYRGTLVHNKEFKRAKELIEDFIPLDGEDEKKNLHNTITVLGTRGSGKTSFLLSVKRELSKNQTGKQLQILDIIDPTLIEEKGHVFLNVIAIIKELIDKKLNLVECEPSKKPAYSRKEWRSALNKLAAGLPSIDGIGSNGMDSWQDPEFVMDNGLKAVHASQDLADNFNEFLRLSLAILEKKAFLVMFDDIDVDATKGWAVLETIRKYFIGGRLITIVSGDSQLYSTVVRQQKWQNFGAEILKYEGERLGKLAVFNDMITELESQYLQKVLQPKNRIHLSTIGTSKRYEENKKFYIYEKTTAEIPENDSENEISSIYNRILRYFGINNGYQAKAYSDYLLELPLRTQVQFLNLFDLKTGAFKRDDANIVPLTDIFLSDLYAKNIEINTAIRSPKNLNRLILEFLLRERKLEELYQLQPITTADNLNASLLSLNFLSSYNMQKDESLIFDYFIKIGYTRNLLPLLGYSEKTNNALSPSIEDLCNNTVILNDNVLKDVVGKIIAYLRGTIDLKQSSSEKVSQAGTIPLFGLASSVKRNTKATTDRIDSVLKNGNADYVEQRLVYMPLSSNQYIYKQASLLTYSPYLLLGAIGELIRKSRQGDIKNGFTELSQFRGYMMPDFKRGENKEEFGGMEEDPQDLTDKKSLAAFDIETAFSNWVEKYPAEGMKISVHLLGKISTRFFYALTNLESRVGNKNLGEVFHSYILTFMNSVLVEDCRENANYLASELNLNNTNYKDSIFIKNINKLIHKDDKNIRIVKSNQLNFSQWLLACPLLLVYLKKDSKIKYSLSIYCDEYLKDSQNNSQPKLLDIDLQKFLDKIPIRREAVEKVHIVQNPIEKVISEKNENRELSIGNISDYDEIFEKFRVIEFPIEKLKTDKVEDLRKELKTLGITRPSTANFTKFLEYLNEKRTK